MAVYLVLAGRLVDRSEPIETWLHSFFSLFVSCPVHDAARGVRRPVNAITPVTVARTRR
jgi:hypothetical protein